jgi:hypothetical protein
MTMNLRTLLFVPAITSLLVACTAETIVTNPAPSDTPTPTEPTTPGTEPGTTPGTEPGKPTAPAKSPTLAIDGSFAGGAGITDGTNDLYAATPGPSGAVYVTLRKAGGALGWGGGTLVRRYLEDGTRDAAFAAQGELDTKLVGNPQALATDAKGNVLVGGSGYYDGQTPDSGNEVVVLRVTSAGAVDATYGSGGRIKLTTFTTANTWTTSLRVRDDGGAFVAVWGRTNGKERYGAHLVSPTGTAVTGFGTGGVMSSPFPTDGALALGNDVAVPSTSGYLRYGPDGAAKGTLISDGVAMAKKAPDGSFIAVVSDGTSLSLAHFFATGTKDATFAASAVTDSFADYLPLADGSVLTADGADLSWVSPAGGAATVVVKGAKATALGLTDKGKLLVTSGAGGNGGKVVRYTM